MNDLEVSILKHLRNLDGVPLGRARTTARTLRGIATALNLVPPLPARMSNTSYKKYELASHALQRLRAARCVAQESRRWWYLTALGTKVASGQFTKEALARRAARQT